jgi:hypothetical protein
MAFFSSAAFFYASITWALMAALAAEVFMETLSPLSIMLSTESLTAASFSK